MAEGKSRRKLRISLVLLVLIFFASLAAIPEFYLLGTTQGSLAMRLAYLRHRARSNPSDTPAELVQFADWAAHRRPQPAAIPSGFRDRYVIGTTVIRGSPVFTLTPKEKQGPDTIIYLHGGAYVSPLSDGQWIIVDALSRATGARMVVPAYPLAPQHNNRETWPLLTDVYLQVLEHARPENVVFAGESAGGGLALGEVFELRERRLPLPARLILLAPWADATLRNPAIRAAEPDDPTLRVDQLRMAGKWWAGPDPAGAARISPLFADLSGFPPVDILQGTKDIFVVTSRELAGKLRASGVPTRYFEFPGAIHGYVVLTDTPEARDTFQKIGAVVGRRPGQSR